MQLQRYALYLTIPHVWAKKWRTLFTECPPRQITIFTKSRLKVLVLSLDINGGNGRATIKSLLSQCSLPTLVSLGVCGGVCHGGFRRYVLEGLERLVGILVYTGTYAGTVCCAY